MFTLLLVAFIVVPLAEIAVIIEVGSHLGVVPTIALLLAISILGAFLVKREGLGVIRRIGRQLDARRVPGAEVIDGAVVLLAGGLLLTPGFITDTAGLILLLPPVRGGVRRLLRRRFIIRVGFGLE
ncbi:MAG: FxsA family protein [Acidimicrobiia bacterium]